MSIAVTGYPKFPYRQTPIGWPVVAFEPPKMKPTATVLTFDWSVYFALAGSGANIGVTVDLNSGGTSQGPVLDKLVTAKIDNSNSYNPILIYFPDSKDTISCPPQSIVTLPCVTNGSNCVVIAQGLQTGFLPTTTITFYNYFVPPSIDPVLQITYPQEIGSPSIQRNSNQILTPGFGARALGDQFFEVPFVMTGGSPTTYPLWATPLAINFIYLTQIYVAMNGINTGNSFSGNFFIESTGSAGILITVPYSVVGGTSTTNPPFVLLNLSGNYKIDATQTWRVRLDNPQGYGANSLCTFYFSYSTNDK